MFGFGTRHQTSDFRHQKEAYSRQPSAGSRQPQRRMKIGVPARSRASSSTFVASDASPTPRGQWVLGEHSAISVQRSASEAISPQRSAPEAGSYQLETERMAISNPEAAIRNRPSAIWVGAPARNRTWTFRLRSVTASSDQVLWSFGGTSDLRRVGCGSVTPPGLAEYWSR